MTEEKREIVPKGVGLYTNEWDELDKIAKKYQATLHGMAVYAIRYFISEYKKKNIKIRRETKLGKPE